MCVKKLQGDFQSRKMSAHVVQQGEEGEKITSSLHLPVVLCKKTSYEMFVMRN